MAVVEGGRSIVGREQELELVRSFLDSGDGPKILVIEGEPGIGKTTLWQEGVASSHAGGHVVLTSRPAQLETRLSFSGLSDLLTGVAEDVLPELPPPQREGLEVALLRRRSTGQVDRRAVAAALLAVLRAVAETQPVLIAVDDVQWLDKPSVAALDFAMRRVRDEPIRMLLTVRRDSRTPEVGLVRSLPDHQVEAVELSPLTLGALHHLVVTRLGASFPRPLLRRIYEASGGNPLYALELARALRRRVVQVRPGEPLPVPRSLRQLMRARLEGLPEHARDAVSLAATLTHPTVAALESAGRLSPGAIDAALEAGVLELDGEIVRFAHPLLASVVYSSLGHEARRELHRRAARASRDPEEAARHLALGTPTPNEEVASALAEAAAGAAAHGAPEAAAELAELSLRLTPARGKSDLLRRRLQAADYHYRAGAVAPARSMLETIVDELPAGGERAEALCRLAVVREDDFEVERALLEQAADEAGSDDHLLAEIDFLLSQVWHARLDLPRALAHARGALQAAERLDDSVLVARNLAQVALIEKLSGQATLGLLERGVELERKLDPYSLRHRRPSAVLGLRLVGRYELDAARPLLEQAYDIARGQGDAYAEAASLLYLFGLESRAGNWPRALSYAEEGLELVEQLDLNQSRSALLSCKAHVLALLGNVEEAAAAAEQAVALSEAANDEIFRLESLATLGFLELSLGEYAAADAYLNPVVDRLFAGGHRDPATIPALPDAIESSIGSGDGERARLLLRRLEDQARRTENDWGSAVAARCRGLLRASEGDLDRALAELTRALDHHERISSPFDLGRTLLALGSVQRRARHRREARDSLARALGVFEQVGAALWAERARNEMARLGGREPSADALTTTERRIAELVAQGRTNKDVAALLFVAPRTVEGHLTRIYEKLGVRSRAELAHLLASGEQNQGVSTV